MTAGDHLQRGFRHFAEMTREQAPLYAALSARVADDSALLAMAAVGEKRHPPPNLLFGAVQFLLLSGAPHPLAAFYPSVGGTEPVDGAWPAFEDFCQRFREEILDQVRRRRVQTNEVGRCGLLVPAISMVANTFDRPLHLIEVGASAGLNLNVDFYRCEYSNGHSVGGDSPVVIHTELRGSNVDVLPLPVTMPAIADRVGIDIEPIDVFDQDAMLWTEALIWPGDALRFERHRAAVTIARNQPPRLLKGDGLDLVSGEVAAVAQRHVPCVFHSHAIYQMDSAWRTLFIAMLDALGRQRDMAHISLEWLGDDPGPQLRATMWINGERSQRHLASCHPHGRWMEPLAAS